MAFRLLSEGNPTNWTTQTQKEQTAESQCNDLIRLEAITALRLSNVRGRTSTNNLHHVITGWRSSIELLWHRTLTTKRKVSIVIWHQTRINSMFDIVTMRNPLKIHNIVISLITVDMICLHTKRSLTGESLQNNVMNLLSHSSLLNPQIDSKVSVSLDIRSKYSPNLRSSTSSNTPDISTI